VQRLLSQKVEMVAIFQRLQDDHGFTGSYSAVRRYVHQLRPATPEAVVRVHSAPGEEMQVDFGSVGKLVDPANGQLRSAYAFVATLCFSRHQYAELVFDQKVATWIALHRRALSLAPGMKLPRWSLRATAPLRNGGRPSTATCLRLLPSIA
jgi:transposase